MVQRIWSESGEAKSRYVRDMFSSLASRYDRLTDVWTFGLHRVWKKRAMALCALQPGERLLDVATGTGDLAAMAAAEVGPGGRIVGVDSCDAMLRVVERRCPRDIVFRVEDATDLHFPDAFFDVVTIGFGLRNVADRPKALREFRRVLRPGGRLMVLDFSTPSSKFLVWIHNLFYFVLMPIFGWAVAWHRDAHHYTADSIRGWLSPDQLSEMILAAGFREARYVRLTGGFATVHCARVAGP
jgi:demethylmenaquinone methyltransferase/2-methoxy-6-polyprenyl-1,4-benzoquinol methylase